MRRRSWLVAGLVAGPASLLIAGLVGWNLYGWSSTPFDSAEPVGDRELRVSWTGGACDDRWRVEVAETTDTVSLEVRTRVVARACNDVGVGRSTMVTLEEPLGDRRIVNRACQDPDKAGWTACIGASPGS